MNCIQCFEPCTGDSVIKFECDESHIFHVSCLAKPPSATKAKQCPMCFGWAMERKRRALKKDIKKLTKLYERKVKEYDDFVKSCRLYYRGSI
jgi:hypothetical protein